MLKGHAKVMLQFSGGKDSLACLWLLKEYWPYLTVAWVNTGDAFPETIAQMDAVRSYVPNFLEIKSDQPAQISRSGPPMDLLPVWDTQLGRSFDATRRNKFQTPFSCCGENLWEPMMRAAEEGGYTLVIRGQRDEENKKANIRSGHVENGIEYWFPIESWSRVEVINFLKEQNIPLPPHYAYFDSSLDCQHCTAYLDPAKSNYIRIEHPALAASVKAGFAPAYAAARIELVKLQETMEALNAS